MSARVPARCGVMAALALSTWAGLPARADDSVTPAGKSGTSGSSGTVTAQPAAPKVRASHRIEIIAPGERVETVLDRLRAVRSDTDPSTATSSRPTLPVREPDPHDLSRRPDAGQAGAAAAGGGTPPTGPGTSGSASLPTGPDGGRPEGTRPHR